MSKVGEYLLSVIAAAMVITLASAITEKKRPISSIIKFATGIMLVAVILSPIKHLRIGDISGYLSGMRISADPIIQEGEEAAKSEIQSYIMTHSKAYILDKAATLDLDVSVDVELSDDVLSNIQTVSITGNAAPYAKQRLTQMICEDLGVSEEAILWS